jgi:hypothetical protein
VIICAKVKWRRRYDVGIEPCWHSYVRNTATDPAAFCAGGCENDV